MIITILYFLALISGIFAVKLTGIHMTAALTATIMLQFFLLVSVGLSGIIGFIGHVFRGETAARLLGWPSGNPFQKELGFWDLAGGIGAVLCFWQHREFWLAVIVINTIFWMLAGSLHVKHVIKEKNYHLDNALPAIMDFVVPITAIILYLIATG